MIDSQPRTAQGNPMINVYRAGDDRWFWLLGVEADRLWAKLPNAVGHPEWHDDERWRTARDRRHNAVALISELDALFATRPRDQWTAAFDAHDVWWAPVNTPDDVVGDPQLLATGGLVDVPGGPGSSAHRAVASPVSFPSRGGRDEARPRGPVPALGEHTDEIRRELDVS